MDSNHDKVIQSHLCYRYTTRQKGGEFATAELDKVNPSARVQLAQGRPAVRQVSSIGSITGST
jgi:hypothetical protein